VVGSESSFPDRLASNGERRGRVQLDATTILLILASVFLIARSLSYYARLLRGFLRQRRGHTVHGETRLEGAARVDGEGNIVLEPVAPTLTLSVPGLSTELLLEMLRAPPVSPRRLLTTAVPVLVTLLLLAGGLWVILNRAYDQTAVTTAEFALAWLVGYWTPRSRLHWL
jgi:hypothetical protein